MQMKLSIRLLTLVVTFIMLSCKKNCEECGVYKSYDGGRDIIKLNEDGSFDFSDEGDDYVKAGTWKGTADSLTLFSFKFFENGQTFKGTLINDTLTLISGGIYIRAFNEEITYNRNKYTDSESDETTTEQPQNLESVQEYSDDNSMVYNSDDPEGENYIGDGAPSGLSEDELKNYTQENSEFYIVSVSTEKYDKNAKEKVKSLKDEGFEANYLWIPDYESLSKAKYYAVYIGPFSTQNECAVYLEEYKKKNPNAYGLLVSQQNKRVQINGVGKIKVTEPYHHY